MGLIETAFYELLIESFSTNLTWFLFPSMLQFAIFLFIYGIVWLLQVCFISVLGQFLFEIGKKNPKLHWFFLGSVIGPENSRH